MENTLKIDGNNHPIPVSGSFIVEEVTLTGTAFTDNDVEIPDECAELMLISDTAFEVSQAVDGDGFPVAADIPITVGVANMDKVWLKGEAAQTIQVMYRYI